MADANPGTGQKAVTKRTSPGEFIREVRQETRKITWPTWKETRTTSIFVGVFTLIMALFFLVIDQGFGLVVRWLISLA